MIQRTVTITVREVQEQLNTILPDIKITTEQHAENYNRAKDLFFQIHNAHELPLEEFTNYVDTIQCLHRIATETFRKRVDIERGHISNLHQPVLDREKIINKRKKVLKEAKKNLKTSKYAKQEFLIQELMDDENMTEEEARAALAEFKLSLKK